MEFEAHPAQLEVLKASAVHRFIVLDCGRRFGKDHLAAIRLLVDSFSRKSPRGAKLYAWLNPTFNPQGKESFRVFLAFAQSAGLVKRKKETPPMEITLINDDRISFFSLDQPDNLRGGQYDGIIINEAGLLAGLEEIWAGPVAAMLLDRLGWAWIMGTPKGKNAFHRFFQKGLLPTDDEGLPNQWKSFQFPSHANPFLDRAELDRLRKDLPDDMYRQEYLAEFLDGGGSVFKGIAVMQQRSAGLALLPHASGCRIGMDIARHTDFCVLLALDPNNKVVGFDRFNQLDWDTIKQRVYAFCMRYRGKVVVDTAGAGDPIYEMLMMKGIPVSAARFTNEAKTRWVQNLMSLIEDGAVYIPLPGTSRDPSHDTLPLWQELEVYGYEILPSGKIRYGAPQGFHDDAVTALFLAASEMPPMHITNDELPEFMQMNLDDVREVGEVL